MGEGRGSDRTAKGQSGHSEYSSSRSGPGQLPGVVRDVPVPRPWMAHAKWALSTSTYHRPPPAVARVFLPGRTCGLLAAVATPSFSPSPYAAAMPHTGQRLAARGRENRGGANAHRKDTTVISRAMSDD
eukprot:scaffold7958_cov133-Isochrysis_galbana.AAC.2